ncbi:MAG: hypothetical protein ACREQ9_07455, partial [Candidatus Binatia bacterium]
LIHTPAVLYALYMAVLCPVTYYRHYLPLLPTVVLLAAYGFWESRWAARKGVVAAYLIYPLLLTADSEYNLWNDPRRELRDWHEGHEGARVAATYYLVPPPRMKARLFDPDLYLRDGRSYLELFDYVILSENWYDTAFPNELNGPIAWKPEWLIRTKPEYALVYRRMLANQDPNVRLEASFDLRHIAPELLVHRLFYGSFPLFVGDLKVFRVTVPAFRAGPDR